MDQIMDQTTAVDSGTAEGKDMARQYEKLTSRFCRTVTKPGLYSDGGDLYLKVGPSGAKSWVFRYQINGRTRDMGLGPYHTIGLAEARRKALECRQLRHNGLDPMVERDKSRPQWQAAIPTFRWCAEQYIADHQAGWRNPKHGRDWENSLATYAYPLIGKLPVDAIDLAAVLRVIQPHWESKTVTMDRVRSRIELTLAWATIRGYRQGDNPAKWQGHLETLLPRKSRIAKVAHMAALPYAEAPGFVARLRAKEGVTARALELLILTCTRSNEVLGARWSEIDLPARLWVIPAERMKKGDREHRVPLSAAAVAVLEAMQAVRTGDFVFPGSRAGGRLHERVMLDLVGRMLPDRGITVHGFRSAFSDWCAEQTGFSSEVRELALAHAVGDKVIEAYRRGDMFDKRRRLAEAWAKFLSGTSGEVVSLPQRAAG
jgi:integrase